MSVSTAVLEHLLIVDGQVLNPTLMDYLLAGSLESPKVGYSRERKGAKLYGGQVHRRNTDSDYSACNR